MHTPHTVQRPSLPPVVHRPRCTLRGESQSLSTGLGGSASLSTQPPSAGNPTQREPDGIDLHHGKQTRAAPARQRSCRVHAWPAPIVHRHTPPTTLHTHRQPSHPRSPRARDPDLVPRPSTQFFFSITPASQPIRRAWCVLSATAAAGSRKDGRDKGAAALLSTDAINIDGRTSQ